jgi:hypothetical protein
MVLVKHQHGQLNRRAAAHRKEGKVKTYATIVLRRIPRLCVPKTLSVLALLRRPEPDRERIVRINRINIWLAGMQGLLQIAIILVMAKYVS